MSKDLLTSRINNNNNNINNKFNNNNNNDNIIIIIIIIICYSVRRDQKFYEYPMNYDSY